MPHMLMHRTLITPDTYFSARIPKEMIANAVYYEIIASNFDDPGDDWCITVFYDEEGEECDRFKIDGY